MPLGMAGWRYPATQLIQTPNLQHPCPQMQAEKHIWEQLLERSSKVMQWWPSSTSLCYYTLMLKIWQLAVILFCFLGREKWYAFTDISYFYGDTNQNCSGLQNGSRRFHRRKRPKLSKMSLNLSWLDVLGCVIFLNTKVCLPLLL